MKTINIHLNDSEKMTQIECPKDFKVIDLIAIFDTLMRTYVFELASAINSIEGGDLDIINELKDSLTINDIKILKNGKE